MPLIAAKYRESKSAGVREAFFGVQKISGLVDDELAQFQPTHAEPFTKTLTPQARQKLDQMLSVMSGLIQSIHEAANS